LTFPSWYCMVTTIRFCRSARRASYPQKFLKNATLKVYPGFPHGMCTTNADQINADLLAFVKDSAAHSSSRGAGILTTA
jgi:hypothetical protein